MLNSEAVVYLERNLVRLH